MDNEVGDFGDAIQQNGLGFLLGLAQAPDESDEEFKIRVKLAMHESIETKGETKCLFTQV